MSEGEVRRVILDGFQIKYFRFLKGNRDNTLKVHEAQALDGNGAIQLADFGSLYIHEQLSVPPPNFIEVKDQPRTSATPVEGISTSPVEDHPGTNPVEDRPGTNPILVEDCPSTSTSAIVVGDHPGISDSPGVGDSSRGPLMAKLTELITRLRVSFLKFKYIRQFRFSSRSYLCFRILHLSKGPCECGVHWHHCHQYIG